MLPNKKPLMAFETTPDTLLDPTRSFYGDSHTATDNTMLVAHARHLQHLGVIDEHMVGELTKPYSKLHVHSIRYSSAYLALHPDYTGEDADTVPTLQSAKKRQREEDEAEKKMLEDYRAGRIDIWGKKTCDMTEKDDNSSSSTVPRTPAKQKRRTVQLDKTSTEAVISDTPKPDTTSLPVKRTPPTTAPLPFKKRIAHFTYNPDALSPNTTPPRPIRPPRKIPTHTPHNRLTPSKAPTSSPSSPRLSPQRASQPCAVTPLQPLPGNTDYAQLDYYKATALCRKRGIPSGGNVQKVRNSLIRDDVAVSEGGTRVMASGKYRRAYRTVAPGDRGNEGRWGGGWGEGDGKGVWDGSGRRSC